MTKLPFAVHALADIAQDKANFGADVRKEAAECQAWMQDASFVRLLSSGLDIRILALSWPVVNA